MKLWIIALSLLAAPGLTLAQTPEPSASPRYVSAPVWMKKPTGADVDRFYPREMQRKDLNGAGVVECRITEVGRLADCAVLSENPTGAGLAEGLLRLTELFTIGQKTKDGAPTTGSYVIIPLTLFNPESPSPPISPPAFQAGHPAYVVTHKMTGRPSRQMNCPTAQDARQTCFFHEITWSNEPDFGTAATYVEKIGAEAGRLQMNCSIGADGALDGCAPSKALTPPQADAMSGLLRHFQVPEKAQDGTRTRDEPIALTFDFEAITQMIEVSALKRSRAVAP